MGKGYFGTHAKGNKPERNKLLKEYYYLNPHLSYAQVGSIFRISRGRVEAIIKGRGTGRNHVQD